MHTDEILPYGRQTIDEADVSSVTEMLTSPFLTTGPKVDAFEDRLCQITGARYAIACSNGTTALHLACLALGVKEGDLGVTSPISFLASANCIEYCGGRVDFVDIDSTTICMSPDQLNRFCRDVAVPKVVIPVSFAGIPADLPAIHKLARKFGFQIIEDAAHALGSEYTHDGEIYSSGSCTHSDLAIFSFHPVKTITSGEGGAVLTNDTRLAEKLKQLRNHGMKRASKSEDTGFQGEWYYEMADMGYNYRLCDIQAALGLSQLEKLSGFRERRRQIVKMYNRSFKAVSSHIITPPDILAESACPHLYPVQFKGGGAIRLKIYIALKAENIFTQVHYIPIYWQPYYVKKYGYPKGKCRNAEAYYSRCLSLPLFPAMADGDVARVVDRVTTLVRDA
ncbi:MAG: UDP-4-amino-4,6-dideoxy-N-acetyl-beta-L-altrosamine transaminase [Desulfobacterales bacterium]|nr:UDP-4-amino-4,6-dideoxy-N-acetyl-beta-L-altrosamine transaminase [Desulfobacterales bacterium]